MQLWYAPVLQRCPDRTLHPSYAHDLPSNATFHAKDVDLSKFYGGSDVELFSNLLRGSNEPVGLTCSPIVQDLSGAAQCNQQTVCCDSTHASGLFSIGCTPFNGGSQSAGIF